MSKQGGSVGDKGSIRSFRTDDSVQTAFGYKPPPFVAKVDSPPPPTEVEVVPAPVRPQPEVLLQRNRSDGPGAGTGETDISVPIVFRSDSRYDSSIQSADILSIEERLTRMSGTTYSVAGATSASDERNERRMTPGSDFNIFADPPATVGGSLRSSGGSERSRGSGMSRKGHRYRDSHSYVDDRELSTFGYTPEDLNRVGGTGYGQSFRGEGESEEAVEASETGRKDPEVRSLEGMEGRIPARLSGLSERSTTYQKLLFDVQSQPF